VKRAPGLLAAWLALALVGGAALRGLPARGERIEPAVAAGARESTPLATRELLRTVVAPARDEGELARRFKESCASPAPQRVPLYRDERVGESRDFWVLNWRSRSFFQARATLRYASEHFLFYVQDGQAGQSVREESLVQSAATFENKTLPLLTRYFGELPETPRVTIFNGRVPELGGYFSSSDMLARSVNPFSNERPMVYVNLDSLGPGSNAYESVLTHELQHFVHGQVHPQQDSWINEGASELAMALAGFEQFAAVGSYFGNPETQLTAFGETPDESRPYYGAGYLILDYFAQRMGGYERVKDLIASPGASVATFESYFRAQRPGWTFDDLFRDFAVANIVNDRSVGDGRYGYESLSQRARVQERQVVPPATAPLGALSNAALRPYGVRYVELTPGPDKGVLELRFAGAADGRLYGAAPHSGAHQWWGNAVDDAASTLTREVDLTEVNEATLRFGAWYSTERDYDYAGVAVSNDGGCSWRTLPGKHTTDANPIGQNLGHGFTGKSEGWVDEEMDLTPYAGQKVLLRFFYVTDQSYHASGFAVDDVSIPQISFYDDAEDGDAGWRAEGFIRSLNAAAVDWAVQAIVYGDGGTQVLPLSVERQADGGNATGTLRVPGFGEGVRRVVVAVSPLVPVTLEPIEYRLEAVVR